jgi:hypothetical protein
LSTQLRLLVFLVVSFLLAFPPVSYMHSSLPHLCYIYCYNFYVKTEINGRGNLLLWPRNTLYTQRLALTSPTSGVRFVGIVRLRTTATEFSFLVMFVLFIIFLYTNSSFRWRHTQKPYPAHLSAGTIE